MTVKGKVGFKNFEVSTLIGVHPSEKKSPQSLFLDFETFTQISTDAIENYPDYEAISQFCTTFATKHVLQLVETFGYQLLKQIIIHFHLEEASLTVRKPGALPDTAYAYFEITLNKDQATC